MEKVPYVLSSKKWRDIFEEKDKKKKLLEKEKELWNLKREEKKNQEKTKRQKAVSKINVGNRPRTKIKVEKRHLTKSETNPRDFAIPMSQQCLKNSSVSKLENAYVNNSTGLCYMCGDNFK